MAGKFMAIRKVVLPIMSVIILCSQLAGCATLNSQEFLETVNNVDEVVIEYNEFDPGSTKSDTDTVTVGDKAYGYEFNEEDDSEIGLIDDNKEQLQEITHDELIEVFEKEYELSKSVYNSDSEDTIQGELLAIQFTVDSMDKSLPSDYEDQYRAWRPSVAQQQAPEVTLTFSEVNEQVWATDSVNIRSGPSTDDDKVGQLAKGNSVTRVGIGTGDYSSWSRVQLSDGSIVYVASSYLTTTKPATQSSKPSGNNGTQAQQPNQQPPSGEDRGTTDADSFGTIQTKKDISTGVVDPWANSDKVSIGYGG